MVRDRSVSSRILDIVVYPTLLLIMITTVYPILNVLAMSLSDLGAITARTVTFYPKGLTFAAYEVIIKSPIIPRAFLNSVVYSLSGMLVNVLLACMYAYPLTKNYLTFRKFYMAVMIIPMYIGGGLIPTYLLVASLGMIDSMWALIIPGALGAGNIIIMMTFFRSIPLELQEAALIDGANDVFIFFRIVLPLAKAGIAVLALYSIVGQWNEFFSALIYIKNRDKYPLQLILNEIVIRSSLVSDFKKAADTQAGASFDFTQAIWQERLKYAVIFVSMFPILVGYPFLQKYFAKGVVIGSLKG